MSNLREQALNSVTQRHLELALEELEELVEYAGCQENPQILRIQGHLKLAIQALKVSEHNKKLKSFNEIAV